jgi:hypothetical protein
MIGTEYAVVALIDGLESRLVADGLAHRVVCLFEHLKFLFCKGVGRGYFAGTTSYLPSVRT